MVRSQPTNLRQVGLIKMPPLNFYRAHARDLCQANNFEFSSKWPICGATLRVAPGAMVRLLKRTTQAGTQKFQRQFRTAHGGRERRAALIVAKSLPLLDLQK